jgi:hypothetical protein
MLHIRICAREWLISAAAVNDKSSETILAPHSAAYVVNAQIKEYSEYSYMHGQLMMSKDKYNTQCSHGHGVSSFQSR